MAGIDTSTTSRLYGAGDILVAPAAEADGSYEVSRVSANGRSTHVMGVQTTQSAALLMASRATSGSQRIFLRTDAASTEYSLFEEGNSRG